MKSIFLNKNVIFSLDIKGMAAMLFVLTARKLMVT